jgi:hypothetical protein
MPARVKALPRPGAGVLSPYGGKQRQININE